MRLVEICFYNYKAYLLSEGALQLLFELVSVRVVLCIKDRVFFLCFLD